ncbi:MAG: VapB-type antitoxin [Candidatus Bathyarchaeia archaeon]
MSRVISVRIRREVKEELEKVEINPNEEIRKRLEELAWKLRAKRQIEKWNMTLSRVKPRGGLLTYEYAYRSTGSLIPHH